MKQESKVAKQRKCRGSDIAERVMELDKFGVGIKVNIDGKSEIKSCPGSIISIIIYFLLLIYGLKQFQKLIARSNPNVSTAQLQNYYESNRTLVLDKNNGFKIAFGLREYNKRISLNDSNFIQWNVFLATDKNSILIKRQKLGFHICTDEDYQDFWPPNKSQKEAIEQEKINKELFCINSNETIDLYGAGRDNQRRLVLFLSPPCTTSNQNLTLANCTQKNNLQNLTDYLGAPSLVLLSNNQRFDSTIFSEGAMINESVWSQTLFNPQVPSVLEGRIENFEVDDATEYLNIWNQIFKGWSFIQPTNIIYTDFNIYPQYYKIISLHLTLSQDLIQIQRSTYDLLNLIGDLGGLHDGLYAIFSIFIGTFSMINYQLQVFSKFFSQYSSKYKSKKNQETKNIVRPLTEYSQEEFSNVMKDEFSNIIKIKPTSLLETLKSWILFCLRQQNQSRKRLNRGMRKIDRQLDIVRIVNNLRTVTLSSMSQLTYSQRQVALNLGQQIWVSSDTDRDERLSTDNDFRFMKLSSNLSYVDDFVRNTSLENRNMLAQLCQRIEKRIKVYWVAENQSSFQSQIELEDFADDSFNPGHSQVSVKKEFQIQNISNFDSTKNVRAAIKLDKKLSDNVNRVHTLKL